MNIDKLLKTELGLTMEDVDRDFTIEHNKDGLTLRQKEHPTRKPNISFSTKKNIAKYRGEVTENPLTIHFPNYACLEIDLPDENNEYDLGASALGLGELSPVLVDARGNIIDGSHRRNIDPNWPTFTVASVDDPTKLELARIATNYCRRKMTPIELRRSLAAIAEAGISAEEIAKQTGISLSTVLRYMPQEFKDPRKVEAGKASGAVRS